jgi:hypothetical protein
LTSLSDTHLEIVRSIRADALAVLEGMDYCLDWKPDTESWSAREVIYHLVDTPSGGLHSLLQGVLAGTVAEFDLVPDLTNMDQQRQDGDMVQARQDLLQVLDGIEETLSRVSDEDITGKSVVAHLKARGQDQERTPQILLERTFARHWREHLEQLRELRDSLGV